MTGKGKFRKELTRLQFSQFMADYAPATGLGRYRSSAIR